MISIAMHVSAVIHSIMVAQSLHNSPGFDSQAKWRHLGSLLYLCSLSTQWWPVWGCVNLLCVCGGGEGKGSSHTLKCVNFEV